MVPSLWVQQLAAGCWARKLVFPFANQDHRSKVNTSLQPQACSNAALQELLNCLQSCWQDSCNTARSYRNFFFFFFKLQESGYTSTLKKMGEDRSTFLFFIFIFWWKPLRGVVNELDISVILDNFREALILGLHEINFVRRLHRNEELDCRLASLRSQR